MRAFHRDVVAAATAFLLTSGSLAAQELWTEMSTLGYGGAATGLGIAACWSCGYESAAVVILSAAIGGMVAGHHIGGAAEGAVRRGERPRPLQLLGARFGTVTGFAALGAAAAAFQINNTEGNGPGDDERLLATMTLVGAGVGVVVELLQARGLPPRSVASRLRVGRGPGGRLDITLRGPRG